MCKISVITSVYNCEEYIEETIRSVQNQTYRDWEYILVDDCSKDQSAKIIEQLAEKDSRIKLFKNETNRGQVNNLNLGIEKATGEFIAHLDHDDLIDERAFEKQLAYMEKYPNTLLLGSWANVLCDGKLHLYAWDVFKSKSPAEVKVITMALNTIPHSSFFFRKRICDAYDIKYDNYYKYAEDYAFVEKVAECGDVDFLNEALVTYRVYDGQTTSHTAKELMVNERRKIQNNYSDYMRNNGLEDVEIYQKAINGKIDGAIEYDRLRDFVVRYSVFCGVGNSYRECICNENVQLTYLTLCFYQEKKNILTLLHYLKNDIRITRWYRDRRGLSYIKRCVLHSKEV